MNRQNSARSIGAGLMVLLIAGCSEEKTSAASEPLPDAEAPYAQPAEAPPTVALHAQTPAPAARKPDLKTAATTSVSTGDTDQSNAAIVANHVTSKVDNIAGSTANSAKDSLKDVAIKEGALNGESALKSVLPTDDAQSPFTSLVGNVERGARSYSQCAVCHSREAGKNLIGPTLYNIVDRQAGAAENFSYSKVMGSGDFVWTEDALFAFIENPQSYLPGNRMAFAGVRDEQKRADIVAYLKTLSK